MKIANALTFISNCKTINLLLIIACSVLFIACPGVKDTSYSLEICLENNTEYTLHVKLFPKEEYLCPTNNSLYKRSKGGGGCSRKEYSLWLNGTDKTLYSTGILDYTPTKLTRDIFDSIIIAVDIDPDIDSTIILKFSKKGSINYKTNMYANDSNWVYKKIEDEHRDMLNVYPFILHRYTFNIKTDFIEIQNK
jgi:hypothetical protein